MAALIDYGESKSNPTACQASPFLMPELRKALCEGWEPAAGSQITPPLTASPETPAAPDGVAQPIPDPKRDQPAPQAAGPGEMQKGLDSIKADADRLELALKKVAPGILSTLIGDGNSSGTKDAVDKLIGANVELLSSADASISPGMNGGDVDAIKKMYTAVRKNDLMAERAREYLTKEFDTFDTNHDGFLDSSDLVSLHVKFDGILTDEQAIRNYIADNTGNISLLSIDTWLGQTFGSDGGITRQDIAGINSGALNQMIMTQKFAESRTSAGAKVGGGLGFLAQKALKGEGKMRLVGWGITVVGGVAGALIGNRVGQYQAKEYVPQLQEFFKAYNNILNAPPPAELVQ